MSRCKVDSMSKAQVTVGDLIKYVEELKKASSVQDDRFLGDVLDLPLTIMTDSGVSTVSKLTEHSLGLLLIPTELTIK